MIKNPECGVYMYNEIRWGNLIILLMYNPKRMVHLY
jgi:hypothetical protein